MFQIYILSNKRVIFLILLFGVISSFANIYCYNVVVENNVNNEITEFNSLIRAGDSIVWKNGQYAPEIIKVIDYYKKALNIDSTNQETIFKLAYIYDFTDSVAQAKKYYDKVNVMALKIRNNFANTDYPEIDVNKIKSNFYYNDSLEIVFKRYGQESSINFVYDIALSYPDSINTYWIDSYISKAFNKKIYFTVFGNGEFIARKFDYTCGCKLSFKGKLPDSILVKILKTLEKSRILTLKKIFFGQDIDNNDYYIKRHKYHNYSNYGRLLYSEVTNIETPLFSQSIEILDLDDYSNDKMLSLCRNSNINLIYNPTFPDKEEAKLEILNELWKYIFCTDLTYRYDSNENLTEDEILNDFDSLIKIADENLTNNDTITLNNAIQNYKKALLIRPNDQETLFKIAYLYDLSDSVAQAKKYYDKINVMKLTIKNSFAKTEYPEIDVNKIKKNLLYNDSLEILFKKFGRESSITFDIEITTSAFPTYNDNHIRIFLYKLFNKRIFITVYGNGEFEARKYDSLKKSKVYFEGILPDSTFSVILNLLQEGRILSMKSLFQKEEKSVNRFMGPYSNYLVLITHNMDNPSFERITIETPLVSNSVSIMYLIGCDELCQDTNLFEKGCCKDIQLNYDNKHLNKTDAKIKLLEELWKYIYCIDLSKYSTD